MTRPLAATHDSDKSDATLVHAAIQGDRSALEQLIRRHQGFVYSLAQRILYSPEDAADATQEILICIVTNLASFRGDAAFRTWAYRIAVRQLLAFKKGRVEHGRISGRDLMTLEKRDVRWWLVADHFSPSPG